MRYMIGNLVVAAALAGEAEPARAVEPFMDGARGNCLFCDFIGHRSEKRQAESCPHPLAAIPAPQSEATRVDARGETPQAN